MFSKIRSLIFKLDPELAHTLAIKALKFNYKPIDNIKKDSSIETNIFGKTIIKEFQKCHPSGITFQKKSFKPSLKVNQSNYQTSR